MLEGVIYAAQREFEEKKLQYIGRMYANIAFNESITKAEANQLIRVAEALSYRQLCLIAALYAVLLAKENGVNIARMTSFDIITGYDNISLATELFGLCTNGYISSKSTVFDPAGICPNDLSLSGISAQLFILMDLRLITRMPSEMMAPMILLTGAIPKIDGD